MNLFFLSRILQFVIKVFNLDKDWENYNDSSADANGLAHLLCYHVIKNIGFLLYTTILSLLSLSWLEMFIKMRNIS